MCSPRHTGRGGGFTLAELLAVLALVGILLAIALPALLNLAGQSKLDAAANAVHSAVKMARQHALTYNQPAYVLFHEGQEGRDDLAFRAYAVFTINIHTNPVDQSAGLFLTGWESLPAGVVFDDQASDALNNVFLPGSHGWSGGFNRNRLLRVGSDTFAAFGFKPRGTHYRNYVNDIYLTEGFFSASGQIIRTGQEGKRVRIDNNGKSTIASILFTEDGNPRELGNL